MQWKKVCILMVCILFCTQVPSVLADHEKPGFISPEKVSYFMETTGTSTSFQGSTTQPNSSWYIVRFSSEETMYLNTLNVTASFFEADHRFWGEPFLFTLTNFETTKCYDFGVYYDLSLGFEEQKYIHVNIGSLNYTLDELKSCGINPRPPLTPRSNIVLEPGDWYLICVSFPYDNGLISVSMQLEGNITLYTPTEGSTSFVYETEDFEGSYVYKKCNNLTDSNERVNIFELLNFIFLHKSRAFNAHKNIRINNTFIGKFFSLPYCLFGRSSLQVISPTNQIYKETQTSFGWLKYFLRGDFNMDTLFVGGNGIWQFKANHFSINGGIIPIPATLTLFGADVQLPLEPVDDSLFYSSPKFLQPCALIQPSGVVFQKIKTNNDGQDMFFITADTFEKMVEET